MAFLFTLAICLVDRQIQYLPVRPHVMDPCQCQECWLWSLLWAIVKPNEMPHMTTLGHGLEGKTECGALSGVHWCTLQPSHWRAFECTISRAGGLDWSQTTSFSLSGKVPRKCRTCTGHQCRSDVVEPTTMGERNTPCACRASFLSI